MKRVLYGIVCLFFVLTRTEAQTSEFNIQNYHPASPTAFQFLKYTEMPVSEYTGVSNISVPIYEIKEDGVTIPVKLTYHSGGFRVSDEASWVGLGWDLSIGSIVQQVNNFDDYAALQLLQPDYQNYPTPTDLPLRYAYGSSCPSCNGASWSNPYPIYSGTPTYSYAIATNYYLPINGNFNDPADGQNICTESPGENVDSDPDIFKASFLGYEITFVLNFKTNQIVVLDKPGYAVSRSNNVYEIVVPSGEQFYFQQYTTVTYSSTTPTGFQGGYGTIAGTASKIWMLTKIVTKHKKQIILNYNSPGSFDNYPSYSERWDSMALSGQGVTISCTGAVNQYGFLSTSLGAINGGQIAKTYSTSNENRLFLSSIVFPNGQVTFSTSARNDMLGGQKLDSVQIQAAQNLNTFRLSYSYFNSSSVGGNTYQPSNASEFGSMPNLRLQLLSVADNSGAVYSFSYNPTPLPTKNSLAQDYWGFYNGQLNDTSTIPNPARMGKPQMGNNGNNNSASPYCAQADMLTKIQFPTGGVDSFEYELNQFSNYWVSDSASTTNLISTGNGLRIHSVDYRALGSANAKRTIYTYVGGIDIVPLDWYRNFSLEIDNISDINLNWKGYSIFELCARGFFSSNALGSVNGVGYKEVIKQDVAPDGTTTGRTETYFSDTADNVSNSGIYASQVAVALPPTKIVSMPENGSVLAVLYYDSQNNLLKRVVNSYNNIVSNYYYGVRVFGYGDYSVGTCGQGISSVWLSYPQTLIAFYPIFDFETLLTSTITTEYAGSDSLVTNESYNYDGYNQLYLATKYTPSYYQQNWLEYPYTNRYYYDVASQAALLNDHRLSEVIYQREVKGKYPWQNALADSAIKHYEVASNSAVVESAMSVSKNLLVVNPIPDSVSYDLYDGTYANLLQFTHNYSSNSLIWDYNGEYVIAEVKNAAQSNVAYTSFESTGNGNWNFTGTPTADPTTPTGNNCYSLSQGNITSNALSSSGVFVVSYWIKGSSALSIPGTQSGYPIQGKTINGWTYFEHKVTGQTTVTVSGTGYIDELRLYPASAEMTTYTYNPLVGMSCQCDVDNRVTRYEYDAYNRLKDVRDQDGNIIKTYQYHYQGQ